MIPPVSDVAPGIFAIRHFPVDAAARQTIGIETVCGRCVHKHRDDTWQVFGEALAKGFPVLEDVAPISFVVNEWFAFLVTDPDGEHVPGSARVTVSAGEAEGEIFEYQTNQLRIRDLFNEIE